ncbi:MAG: hypothetical protein AAFY71_24550 [Bacteroidota bacterium]
MVLSNHLSLTHIMIEVSPLSLIDVLELVGTLATVIALLYAIKSFQKSNKIQEAVFVKELFESFKRDRQAILDNPEALTILAEEREVSKKEIIKSSMGSFDIGRAYLIFHLNERNLIPKERWQEDIKDMKVLFSDALIQAHWQKTKDRFPDTFKRFIETEIL